MVLLSCNAVRCIVPEVKNMEKNNVMFWSRIVFAVMAFVFIGDGNVKAAKVESFEIGLQGGYRVDDLDWNIAADFLGSTPNILSELTWSDLETYQIATNGKLVMSSLFPMPMKLRWELGYGWIVGGENQDSDYAGDNRTFEFSRSNNNSDDGSMIDATVGVGPLFYSSNKKYNLAILIGYSYHEQNLTLTDGNQTLSDQANLDLLDPNQTVQPLGPFPNLNSKYETQWWGPWLGLDVGAELGDTFRALTFVELHFADYHAKADWNRRPDLAHPVSFEHWGNGDFGIFDGYGVDAGVDFSYDLSEFWMLNVEGKYRFWKVKNGIDRVYFEFFSPLDTRLNEVNWESISFMLGIAYKF